MSEEKDELQTAHTLRRLMITQLVMENFKSYGGVKEIGPFHTVPFFEISSIHSLRCFPSAVGAVFEAGVIAHENFL